MQEHLKLGEAVAPMREQGVMIVGSGLSFHNMREFVIKGRGDPKSANNASQVSHDCHLDPTKPCHHNSCLLTA